ncbi:MAG: WYL domain-containing protein [Clostridia bacterium]|nr:WYL domain-containing protein [Clostridia bacterium]
MKEPFKQETKERRFMDLYEKNGNVLYILNILKKYSDVDHMLSVAEIQRKVKELYDVEIDPRTIRRNINLLKYKLNYDISTREDNGKGYFIHRDPETDFEPGEIRAIIDNFSYANYIVPSIAKNIIKKCKNIQTIYENEKIKDYQIYANDSKTENAEVIKNIEDILNSIYQHKKIQFEYWKYALTNKLEKKIVSEPIVSPYAIVYSKQEFYLIGIKEGQIKFYNYRLDRMKNIQILDENIEIKKKKSEIQDFAESSTEMFGGEKVEIEAICHVLLLDTIFDVFGKNATIKKISKDDEHFKLIVDTNPLGFKMWAMRNIDLIEVKRPESLRNEMKKIIKDANKRYNS